MISDVKLLLTRRCNLDCKYCFAKNFRSNSQEPLDMSIELLKFILDWGNSIGIKSINLLGGEPTLHPQFEEILYYTNCQSHMHKIILSNGINLKEFLPYVGMHTSFLLNINSKEDIGEENYNKMLNTLDTMSNLGYFDSVFEQKPLATFGFNIYSEDKSTVDNMFFILDKYNINTARISICTPINLNLHKQDYYEHMKDTVLSITDMCRQRNIYLLGDCSIVPPCYFTSKELLLLQSVWGDYSPRCSDICAINTSGTVIPCFANKNYDKMLNSPRKFFEFTTNDLLCDYVSSNAMINTIETCKDCPLKYGGCINGCGGCEEE